MANRHNVIQTPPREKRAQTLALQNLTDERLRIETLEGKSRSWYTK